MTVSNTLQTVQTYQKSGLALLLNSYAAVSTFNKKFENFQNEYANLGSSIGFELPPDLVSTQGLVASFQSAVQRLATLTVNQSANVSYAFTNQERIFNVDKKGDSYLPAFVKRAIAELGAAMEANILQGAHSQVVTNPDAVILGTAPTYNTDSGPYRFYTAGATGATPSTVTDIASFENLAAAHENFRDYGYAGPMKAYIPMNKVSTIIGSGLSKFTLDRGNETAMSWEIGSFDTPEVVYHRSNLLPIHKSGTIGDENIILFLTAVDDSTGAAVTQLTCTGAGGTLTTGKTVVVGDLLEFNDTTYATSGQANLRYLTKIGHQVSGQKVQCKVTAATAVANNSITISISPALSWVAGPKQNINYPLVTGSGVAGATISILPSHRCGLIIGGDAGFLAMPRLPDQPPYDSSSEYDEESGASLRLTYGSLFGQNKMGIVHDAIWDSLIVPEYCMRLIFKI